MERPPRGVFTSNSLHSCRTAVTSWLIAARFRSACRACVCVCVSWNDTVRLWCRQHACPSLCCCALHCCVGGDVSRCGCWLCSPFALQSVTMPHSFGYRARTRDMFSRAFRQAGPTGLSTYLRNIKRGDYVDIFANSSIHKGMPHKFYHGRTGVVFNVTRRAIGVEVNKQIRGKILKKRIHVRTEHVRQSKCRDGFLARKAANDAHKRAVQDGTAQRKSLKRTPGQPKAGYAVASSRAGRKPVVMYVAAFDPALKL